MKKIYITLFGIILLIAIAIRFYQLGHVPISPDWDEVSLGYNAYSILLTGKDEYGRFLPVIMESTGDFKPALYAYLAIPSIAIFGLDTFAVRLPSAIFGVVGVIATYFLIQELFKKRNLSLLAMFFMAISPWSVQFSRVAIESNVGDTFNILVALFFIKGLKKPWYLFLSVMFAALNLYVYQSEKVFTPLLVLLLICIYHKQLFAVSRKILASVVVVGALITLPTILFILFNHSALTRLASVNVFSESFQLLQMNSLEQLQDQQNNDVLGKLLDNRRIVFVNKILQNYASHFDANWLFIRGDFTDRHQAPQMSHLYLWALPFLFIGIYTLLFSKFDRKIKFLIIGWFLITPIPASITIEVPHAVRTLNFLPLFDIFTAFGVYTSVMFVKERFGVTGAKVFVSICAVLLLANVLFYLDHYFNQFNYFASQDWQYGYPQIVQYLQQHPEIKKVVVQTTVPLDQSYIFFLYNLKYPPQLYQPVAAKIGHYTGDHAFGIYEFRGISSQELQNPHPGYVYVVGADAYNGKNHVAETINFLNGTPGIKIIKG